MKVFNKIKILIAIAIALFIIIAVVVYPMYSFKSSEGLMQKAAERYFEVNPKEEPTGERIKVLTLQDLFKGSYIKEDIYIPYTDTPCDLKESWVKAKNENNSLKYYVYLKCGPMESNVDHEGPEIKLKGKDTITITKGDKFNDPGVDKVVDNVDGTISDTSIKGKVDSNKVGTYTIEYSAIDKLYNKSTVKRTVIVKEYFKNIVESVIGKGGYYTSRDDNNYVRVSNMLYRIVGFDGENIRAVSEYDIANVDYDGIDEWLNYYEKNINDKSKKLLVKTKYCKNTSDINSLECNKTTEERYSYIPSNIDVSNTKESFMRPPTVSWVTNELDKENAYVTKDAFYEEDIHNNVYVPVKKIYHFGVRPMITIKGGNEVVEGDGSLANPYSFGEIKPAKGGDLLNTRYVGEYFVVGGYLYRILGVEKDGTTRVIAMNSLDERSTTVEVSYQKLPLVYNPNEKGNIGQKINNISSTYFDTSYFVNHKIKVPIYKKDILYGKEIDTKTYTVKVSVPNMYDMFSAYDGFTMGVTSTWYVNSSKTDGYGAATYEAGSANNDEISFGSGFGIRPVGFINKKAFVTSGNGTNVSPYVITK